MKIPRSVLVLTAVNLALLLFSLVQQLRPAFAQDAPPVLRGRALEIVDGSGRVRASISVLPPGKTADGDVSSETVLLRLITERGRPSVKIASSEPNSGLSFAGPTGTQDTYVILQAKGNDEFTEAEERRRARASRRTLSAVPLWPTAMARPEAASRARPATEHCISERERE